MHKTQRVCGSPFRFGRRKVGNTALLFFHGEHTIASQNHISQASGPDRHGATTSLPRLQSPPSGEGSVARHGLAQGCLGRLSNISLPLHQHNESDTWHPWFCSSHTSRGSQAPVPLLLPTGTVFEHRAPPGPERMCRPGASWGVTGGWM